MEFPIYSPVQKIESELLDQKKISLSIKRDDLIHKHISGNKFRKLKYNLLQAQNEKKTKILTFGGAFSNHIAATAFAGKLFGFDTIGIIRGEEPKVWSHTLLKAQENGMCFKFVSREDYRRKNEPIFHDQLKEEFGDFYLVPEGGANALGVRGCAEIMDEVSGHFDFVCVACGTGTTLAGIVSSLKHDQKALGFPALKGGTFLKKEIQILLGTNVTDQEMGLVTDYHFGGYAKIKQELVDFSNGFFCQTGIPVDLVYTAKMFFGLYDLFKKDYFPEGSNILAIHTGGLQGNSGIAKKYELQLDFC